jgi:topoisomerase-4 subunit B
MSNKPVPQASLFDDALNPAPAAPLAENHEPRPDPAITGGYSAKDIEVLEGLEPVRKRPGMYIGGTDERALHHLFAEVLDNSMDEAVAGHAKLIEVTLDADGTLTVKDDGRGIPVDPHPKHPGKSALEVIMTVLHSGGKFSGKAYETSGGLHGVGISVVNALSERVEVTAFKDGFEWRQAFTRGKAIGGIEKLGATKKHGTSISFAPDPVIFGDGVAFKPARLYRMARSKAYLFAGVEIRWKCDPSRIQDQTPAEATFRFPNGLADFLAERVKSIETVTPEPLRRALRAQGRGRKGRVGRHLDPGRFRRGRQLHAVLLQHRADPRGRHARGGLARGPDPWPEGLCRTDRREARRHHHRRRRVVPGRRHGQRLHLQAGVPGPDQGAPVLQRRPAPGGKRPARPLRPLADRPPKAASALLDFVVERAEERLKRRATRTWPAPPRPASCACPASWPIARPTPRGDRALHRRGRLGRRLGQAGARPRTQAILPLRGKILNVASATPRQDGRQPGALRPDAGAGRAGRQPVQGSTTCATSKIIIMTDADVDGAHIASLLITFFYRTMPDMIRSGRLYLALPPLYRMSHGGKTIYARDDAHREELLATEFKGKKPEIGRFKGLGEMMPAQLKETTMDPKKRILARVTLPRSEEAVEDLVEALMGRKPELRFRFIQENAEFAAADLDWT